MPFSNTKLISYAKSGDIASFTKELESASPKTNDRDNLDLLSTLYSLSSTPNIDEFANMIIAKDIRVSMVDPMDKNTWVHHAVYNEKITALKWYLSAKDAEQALKISCRCPALTSTPVTPLELANQIKSEAIRALLKNPPINTPPSINNTSSPLSTAFKQKNKEQFDKLLKEGAHNESMKAELFAIFSKALKKGLYDYAKSCIDAGMSVAKKNADGVTPLFQAIQSGDPKSLELVLEASDAKAAVNIACLDQSPLDLAFERGDEAAIQTLHRFGAKFHYSQTSVPEQKNTQALNRIIFVIKHQDQEAFNKFLPAIQTINNTNKKFDIEVFEAMQYCIEHYETCAHYFKEILDKRRHILTPDPEKTKLEPLLQVAVRHDKDTAFDLLLKANSVPDVVNQKYNDKTVADLALSKNKLSILEKLRPFNPEFTPENRPAPPAHTTEHRSLMTQQLDTPRDIRVLDTLLKSKELVEKESSDIGIRPIEIALINNRYEALVKFYNARPIDLTRGLAMVGFEKIKPLTKQLGKCKDDGPLQLYISMINIRTAEKQAFEELYKDIMELKFSRENLERLAGIKNFKPRLQTYIMKELSETIRFDTLCSSVRELNHPLYIIWNASGTEKPNIKVILEEIKSLNKSLMKKKSKEAPPSFASALPMNAISVAASAPLDRVVMEAAAAQSMTAEAPRYEPVHYHPVKPSTPASLTVTTASPSTATPLTASPSTATPPTASPSTLRTHSLFPRLLPIRTSSKQNLSTNATRLHVVSS